MSVKPGSQNSRILRALADGRWRTVAEIHRRAGTSRLNSRVSELRKHGYVIKHETVGKGIGALGHQYRLLNPPTASELEVLVGELIPTTVPREEVPRDPDHRYRIYRQIYDELDLVGSAKDAEGIGWALISLGSQGVFEGSCLGLLDTYGTEGTKGTWLLNPWDTNPS